MDELKYRTYQWLEEAVMEPSCRAEAEVWAKKQGLDTMRIPVDGVIRVDGDGVVEIELLTIENNRPVMCGDRVAEITWRTVSEMPPKNLIEELS